MTTFATSLPQVLPPRSSEQVLPRHPLTTSLEAARTATGELLEANVWSTSDDELLAGLGQAVSLARQAEAMVLRLVREVDGRDLCKRAGMPDVRAVLRRLHGFGRRSAGSLARLAEALEVRPFVATALAAGNLSAEQAEVIADAVAALPVTVTPGERAEAEQVLVEQATQLDPGELAACGRVIAEKLTITPDVDDPAEARRVAKEADETAEAAYAQRGLVIRPHHSGLEAVTLLVPPEVRAALIAALDPLAQFQPVVDGIRDQRTLAQRRADALSGLLQLALNSGQLPSSGGGLRPQVTVTVNYETLMGLRGGAAVLDDGTALAPAALRRLLCDAEILPVVLGGDGVPLDLGRSRRTYTHHQRRALAVRDRGCVFPGCERLPSGCEAHHMRPWSAHGMTDVDQGALLCPHHHDRVHRERWSLQPGPNGHPQLIPPAGLDPHRKPRQHLRFRAVPRLTEVART